MGVGVSMWVGPWLISSPIAYQVIHGAEVENRFGFDHGSPYMGEPECRAEVLEISTVTPGGAFATAGVCPGDIVTSDYSISEFFMLLGELETTEGVELRIRTPLDSGCWFDWPERTVHVVAP